jgi:AcrR family transcriptional regulator
MLLGLEVPMVDGRLKSPFICIKGNGMTVIGNKTSETSSSKGRGRPRSDRAKTAILTAATSLLRSEGLQGLTIDAVVANAKVSKSTVYRWWVSKEAVAMDAILQILNDELQAQDTGSFAEDMRLLMNQFAAVMQKDGLGYIYVSLLVEAQQALRIEEFHKKFFAERRVVIHKIVARGISRGELVGGVEPDLVADMLFGPIVFRLLTGIHAIDGDMIDGILASVLHGLSPTRERRNLPGQ